jgi:hypothetical protein
MKKVGLVTYCEGNFGSVLQCYATQSLLRERGIACELLRRRETDFAGSLGMKLGYRIDRIRKYVRYPQHRPTFDGMVALLSNGSAPRMNESSAAKTAQFVREHIVSRDVSYKTIQKAAKSSEYTAFFSGSDQIWSGTWFVRNPWWFLRFAPTSKRVAWCPSFGGETVAEYNRADYKKYISQYAYLSSREASGATIIKELTGREAEALSDPVVIFTREQWSNMCGERSGKWGAEPYILLFFLDRPSETAMAMMRRLQAKTGHRVVVFAYEHEMLGDIPVESGDPLDFVSIIEQAAFVLTDSFHACMFSTILGTPFYIFNRNSSASVQSERVRSHVTAYGLEDRYVTAERDVTEEDFRMDETHIHHVLHEKRERIFAYLDTVMKGYGV